MQNLSKHHVKHDDHQRAEGGRTKAATSGQVDDSAGLNIGGEWKFSKNPQFLKDRLDVWNRLYEKQAEKYKAFPREKIKVTLQDGAQREGTSFETTPFDVAKQISKQFAEKIIVAKIKYTRRIATLDEGLLNPEADGKADFDNQWFFWDVSRPLEGDCILILYKFENAEGRETFWHSSAHVLGQTLETEFGVHLCHGPPTENGFFYDSYTGKDIFHDKDYPIIEKAAQKIVAEKQTFTRLILTKEEALELFGKNPFKIQLISSKIPDGGKVTAYRCGNLIDLCTGPHIPTTKMIKAFKVMKNSSAYWLGKAGNDSLQRVYGVTFPSKKELDEYIHLIEEAAKRDHRHIGQQQDLFHMHHLSPGCVFMYPKGNVVYQNLMEMIRREYRVRGYQEVQSPNLFNLKLWKTSGHYMNYKDNIFLMKIEGHGFGMKPMNCPAHCLMFGNQLRTYRELPLRFADFGVLHRNEISGALSGLTRVRRFCQDDAHHFCEPHQIKDEVLATLDFLDHVYGIFGFKFELELSTRPELRLGDEALWDKAEDALRAALDEFGKPWEINAGDGAFYGPKIDIKVFDALKRPHQCGTIQLDFQLPIRFNLSYKTADFNQHHHDDQVVQQDKIMTQYFKADEYDPEDFEWKEIPLKAGFARPVIVHRAIMGSVERFMAILIEHLAGKWPFFLSPRQIMICPVSQKYDDYCHSVYLYLHRLGFQVEMDTSRKSLPNRIRIHQLEQWNFILVAGEQEVKDGTVDIRSRDNKRIGKKRVDELPAFFETQFPDKSKRHEEFYAKAWDAANYEHGDCCAEFRGEDPNKKLVKIFHKDKNNSQILAAQVLADLSGAILKVETNAKEEDSPNGRLPYIQDGKNKICESLAMAKFIVKKGGKGADLIGKTSFQEATNDQWIAWAQNTLFEPLHKVIFQIFGFGPVDMPKYNAAMKSVKELVKKLDIFLKGKQFIGGETMGIADVYIGSALANVFQTVFDPGFRKAMGNLTAWFERLIKNPAWIKRFGQIKMAEKILKPTEGKPVQGGTVKLFHTDKNNSLVLGAKVVAELAGAKVEIVTNADAKNSPNGRLPYAQVGNEKICESLAFGKFIAKQGPKGADVVGKTPFQEAINDQWVAWAQTTLFAPLHQAMFQIFGHAPVDMPKYNAAMKTIKEQVKKLDNFLKGKQFIGGNTIGTADIYLATSLASLFQTVFDPGFRKAMGNVTAWFEKVTSNAAFVKHYGKIKMAAKILKPTEGKAAAPAKKEEKKPEKKDDDFDDLFGDDDEEDAAAAKAAAEAAKAAAKGKKKKQKEVEQSLIMFDVKPLDDETSLDELAQKIFKLTGEGIFWKTEYRKEPLAFGIFKLVVGVVVVDEIASVDDIQERIEAMDDMVQSVEITAFTKI